MSKVTKPVVLDETAKQVVAQIQLQNEILTSLASGINYKPTSIKDVLNVVRAGQASKVFQVGDQIIVPWTDITNGQKYEVPLDITSFGTSTLQDGEELPSMTVQWHYATPFGVQFNQYQAFFYATEGLAAGTYYIEIGTTWGDKGYCVAGKKYQFTLTKPVPAGGQLAGFRGAPDQAPSTWKVYSYNNKTAVDAIETVSVTEGSSGTSLGVLRFGGDGKLNCLQRVAYGYNRWSQSAMRQWLNSEKGVGEWWTPQNDFDRCPDQLATKAGFLTGFDADFLEILRPTKVITALNTVTDTTSSNSVDPLETTYDKIYLPALEQMSIEPELAGEGSTWEYWKRASNMTTKMKKWQTYPQIRTFAIENHTSPQYVRLRSADRGYSYYTWYVSSSGGVYYGGTAINAFRCAPACDFC